MNTLQIENMLRADCKLSLVFEGVFASDCLPLTCDSNTAIVMNLDKHNESGSHWVALFIENKKGEYFDSYGMYPANEYFINFLNRNCKEWTFNDNELQAINSDVCGHYCIWYLGERARGNSMTHIVNSFSKDCATNDSLVRKLVETRYGLIVEKILNSNSNFSFNLCQDCVSRSR